MSRTLYIDRLDGQQTKLDAECEVRSPRGVVTLEEIPDVLADPAGWVEFDSTATDAVDEDAEPWELPDEPVSTPCISRVYARSVVATLLVEG